MQKTYEKLLKISLIIFIFTILYVSLVTIYTPLFDSAYKKVNVIKDGVGMILESDVLGEYKDYGLILNSIIKIIGDGANVVLKATLLIATFITMVLYFTFYFLASIFQGGKQTKLKDKISRVLQVITIIIRIVLLVSMYYILNKKIIMVLIMAAPVIASFIIEHKIYKKGL